MKILLNGKEVSTLDLGMVKIGETKEYLYTLENDSKWDIIEIELSLKQMNGQHISEVQFLEFPKEMKAYKTATLKFSWTPSVEIKSGLTSQLQIKALEVWK